MIAEVAIVGRYGALASLPDIQMLLCCFNRLSLWEHDDLSAPYWRWYWNDHAGASIGVDEKVIALTPSRVVLIPPHTPFSTHTRRVVGHLHLHFGLGLSRTAPPGRVFIHRPSPEEVKCIRRLVRLLDGGDARVQRRAAFVAHGLAASALARVPDDDWAGSVADPRIERVLRALHEHTPGQLSNQTLAREAGIGLNTLLRRFRRVTGTSPHQYILRLRIEQACDLLRRTDATLEDIAHRTGFCDRYHLTRVFQRLLQTGPATFRRRNRAWQPVEKVVRGQKSEISIRRKGPFLSFSDL